MGPTVTLTFEGNDTDLMKSVDKVGDGIEEMGDRIEKTTKDIRSHSKAFDTMAEGTDKAESKFTGFKDVIDGGSSALATLQDSSLSTTEKLIAFGQAGADMAGGLTSFLIPAISTLTTGLRGGLASAMTFIAAHPLMIALIALAAIFVLLWTRSETFREIVLGVFKAVGDFVITVFKGAIDGIVTAWNAVIDFFRGIPEKIGQALGALGGALGNAFKGALNIVIEYLNWWIRRVNDIIHGINVVNPFSDIPPIPQISRIHTGVRTVPGGPGTEFPAILQAGERVLTESEANRSGGGKFEVVGDAKSFLYQMMKYGQRTGKIRRV